MAHKDGFVPRLVRAGLSGGVQVCVDIDIDIDRARAELGRAPSVSLETAPATVRDGFRRVAA